MVMAAPELYRDAPDASPAAPSRAALEARIEELERVVAALTAARAEPVVDRRAELDPVALTRALHPRSLRRGRTTTRRSSAGGTLAMRAVLFDPHPPR